MNKELSKRLISSIVLIPIVFLLIVAGSYYFIFLISLTFLLSVYEWNLMIKNSVYNVFGIIFLFFSYLSIFLIRNNFGDDGLYYFLFIIIICIFTDLGGYIFGKLLKGPKLTKISPNKTYSGVVGGFVLSISFSILFFNYSNAADPGEKSIDIYFLLIILLISGISQIGDIVISYFKRLAKIKDTGKIIPGHGGILDRTDGMIFAFPLSYFLLALDIF